MTADQVSKVMPDNLLSSDTCAIQPPTSVESSAHEESNHAVDQHGQALLNTSAAMPVSGLDNSAEIQPNSSQEEERRGNVLDLVSNQTVSMEASRFSMVEVDPTNVALVDIGNDGASNSSIQATGHKVPEDEDVTLRSQPTAYFHSQADAVSESLKANSVTVEPVGSEYIVFQDVVVDDSGYPCISDSQVWSKTISTGSPMIPDHHDDAAETVAQSFDQNSFDLLSTNQETKVPESSQEGENTPPTFKAVSNTDNSMQTQAQPRARQLNRESSAVGNIPETNFEMDWIRETLQDVMTVVDSEGQGDTVCNTERGNVIQTDAEMSGIVEETVTNISLQTSGIVQDTVCHTDSEISDSTEDIACNIDPEIGGIVGGVVSSISSGQTDITHVSSNIAGEISHKTEPGKSSTTGENTYEISHSINSKVLDNITEETHSETVCNTGSEMGCIFGESLRGIDSEVSAIIAKTAHYTDCVGLTVPNADSEINDMTGGGILNSDSDVCDSQRYDLTVDSSSTNDVNPEPEIPGILEPLHKPAIEVNKPITVCDTPVLEHPSTQPRSVELNGNNVEDDGNSALISDLAIPNPSGMSADSTSNLLANVFTPPSKSCVLEYPVPDRITHSPPKFQLESKAFHSNDPMVANMPENNPDTHLQIPGFLHTSSESPQISEEAETDLPPQDLCHTPAAVQDLDSSCKWVEGDCSEGTGARCSNQLWTDACQFLALEEDKGSIFDEWGNSPAPSPPRVSPDNTKPLANSQGREAAIGQLVCDWELPPIESWSSSDSWASALSDWFQSVSVFTEDSPLVATTTSCSSPVDSLSLPCLPNQDTTKRQKDSPENSSASGQMCLPPCSREVGVDSQSSGVPKDDNSNGLVQQLADKDLDPHTESYTAGNTDLTGESEVTLQEKEMEVENVNPYGAYMPNLGSHVREGTVAPVLPMKDYSAGKPANQHISGTKQDSDAVWGVAEDRTSQLSPDCEEESIRNYGSLKLSDYPSNKAPTAGCVCGPCFDTCTPQLDRHVPSELEHLTHAHGVPHSRSSTEGSWSHVSLYTKDSETSRGRGRAEDPLFIMPFAPISIGTSFYHPSSKTSSKPSLIGVTNELSRVDHTGCSPDGKPASGEESSDDQFHTCSEKSCEQASSSSCIDSEDSQGTKHKTEVQKASDISQELSKLILLSGQRFMVSEKKHVAYVTLDLDDVLNFNKDTSLRCDQGVPSPLKQANCEEQLHPKDGTMPQKTPKTSSEGKTRSKHKEKMTGKQLGTPSKKQEKVRPEPQVEVENECLGSEDSTVTVIETIVITEKVTPKPQGGKKKKKPGMAKPESEPLAEVENGARPKATKAKNQGAEATLTPKSGKAKEKPALPLISTINAVSTDNSLKATGVKQHKETEAVKAKTAKAGKTPCGQESQSTCLSSVLDDDIIKRRRISGEKTEVVPIRTRPQLPAIFRQKKEEDVAFKKAYSDVVKQKIQTHKEVVVAHVVAEIQAAPVPEDPQSISLWCQFSPVTAESSISWTKEGKILSEKKRGAGDDSRVTLSILKACSKDLGMYRCCLTSTTGSVSTSEYHLTSEVLMELVLPSHDTPAERSEVDGDEEDVHCASLLFRDDILTEQYFGENQPASIVTEKAHFGEGMHRKAFRTTLRAGMVPVFNPGHPCVLKVHNAITYGTKNNEELIQKNYNLAVEECHVQNTAREYIKAYTNIAKSTESFGEVPEIIPIYLVHRPSSDIPYATLEEELIGDFVKYSVKDGKEINLMRRDSEAGQKCCTFQHWVYSQTDGNLLVTDMQGVGMRLTDVGIATCKKGYKGFKGNCATTFIDQFKALHQCNRFCELLGLTSLQPKPKRTVAPPKPKTQPAPKKKTFGPVLKSKS